MSQRETPISFHQVTRERQHGGISTISFSVAAGDVYAVLGGPGSGKTTICDLVLGFRRPDTGAVNVLGCDPAEYPAVVRRQVAFVDGRNKLPGPMTPAQNLKFIARLTGCVENGATLINALRTMGLADRFLNEPIENLPTPAHVSVWLALAWLRRTPLLVLDDPTAGFDSVATATLIDCLDRFRRTKVTVLMTTSDVLLAGNASDHIAILKSGEKIAERHRHQLLQESLTALYADYIGRTETPRSRS